MAAATQRRGERIIKISPMGNVGNRMIQYLAALALAQRVPQARVTAVHLPEWGIQIVPPAPADVAIEVVTSARIDHAGLAERLISGQTDRVDIRSYAQRMENFLPVAAYRGLFGGPPEAPGAGAHELLINIRQGDVLDGHHPDYVLVPIEFYAELVAQTGLAPVIMGQLQSSPYMEALRARFAQARYVPSRGVVADFNYMRASANIVPSVSTFSWLAAWLSEAQRIFLPVLGLLHPLQVRSVNLLPLDDARYQFHLFPLHYAVPVGHFAAAHATLGRLWRQMPAARLQEILARAASPPGYGRDAYMAHFSEAHYLRRNPDVAAAVQAGSMPSGAHHYFHFGYAEGRFYIDPGWYCRTYPMAAFELSQGDAYDVFDHWLRFGRERGWRLVAA